MRKRILYIIALSVVLLMGNNLTGQETIMEPVVPLSLQEAQSLMIQKYIVTLDNDLSVLTLSRVDANRLGITDEAYNIILSTTNGSNTFFLRQFKDRYKTKEVIRPIPDTLIEQLREAQQKADTSAVRQLMKQVSAFNTMPEVVVKEINAAARQRDDTVMIKHLLDSVRKTKSQ
jgi:hypothetical protein